MADGEYFTVEGTNQQMRNVTERMAETLRTALTTDLTIPKLNFPRLRLLTMSGLGYSGSDFRMVAEKIRPTGIRVYETKENYGYHGKFSSVDEFDFYVLAPTVTASPALYMKTLVHETAHAVQEWKKWRESPLDQEVDGHFAEALYLVLSGKASEAKNDSIMTYFIIAAEAYADDPKCITSNWFRNIRANMRDDILRHYRHMHKKVDPNFNEKEFDKEFNKKTTPNGID